jgi:hypothetical protein
MFVFPFAQALLSSPERKPFFQVVFIRSSEHDRDTISTSKNLRFANQL